MAEPLPCPFCGGSRIKTHYIRDGRSIGCQDCGASLYRFNGPTDITDRLIAAWNCRPALQKGQPVTGWRLEERDDDALIVGPHWQFGETAIARRPRLMSNDEWRLIANFIIERCSAHRDALK